MKSILTTAALVLLAVWAWTKFAKHAGKTVTPDMTSPVDTGMFYGPYADPVTGAYVPQGTSTGAVQYQTQPVGVQ